MGWDTGNSNPFGSGGYNAQTNPYANQPPGTVPTGAPGTPPGTPPPGGYGNYPGDPQLNFSAGPQGVSFNDTYGNFGRFLGAQSAAPPPGMSMYGGSMYGGSLGPQYNGYNQFGTQYGQQYNQPNQFGGQYGQNGQYNPYGQGQYNPNGTPPPTTPGAPPSTTTTTTTPDAQLSSFDGTIAMESNLTIDEVKQLAKKNKPELGNNQGITAKDLDGAIAEMEKSGDPDKAKKLSDMNALKNYVNKQSGKSGSKKSVSDFSNMNLESGLSTSDINSILGREGDEPVNSKDIKKAYNKLKKGDVDSDVLDELDASGETDEILADMRTAYKKLGGKESKLDTASNAFEENTDALKVLGVAGKYVAEISDSGGYGTIDGLQDVSKKSVDDIAKGLKDKGIKKDGKDLSDEDLKKLAKDVKNAAKFVSSNKELCDELGGEDGKYGHELRDMIDDKTKTNELGKKSSSSEDSSSDDSSSEDEEV